MMKVFIDTSAIVAAMNKMDNHHQPAKEVFLKLAAQRSSLIITNYIRSETHSLLINRASREIALKFLDEKSWTIEWISPADEQKAIQLIRQYSDKSFSLTDATSFVIMERLEINTAVTFDQHFAQYGFKIFN